MFRSQTANLPPEQRQRVHADFLADEQAYLHMRDQLLSQYAGQWVAVHRGRVIAAGDDLVTVMSVAAASGGRPYVARVGAEDNIVFRIRWVEFVYDASYQPFALPQVTITFWNYAETHSQTFSNVIPDTGADVSVLPDGDCTAMDLYSSPYLTGVSSGVHGGSMTGLIYWGKVEVNGSRVPAFIQPLAGAQERLVGRDVLNQHRVVFDGPRQRVIFEP